MLALQMLKQFKTLTVDSASPKAHVRSDVQGLRGVAVALVVAYHLDLPVSGGFIGVDMFFVISGFVISKLIAREFLSSSQFSLRKFYARRIRRIVPLYGVVTLTTVLVAQFLLSPFGEVQQVTSTGVWSAMLAANEMLMREDSYLGLVNNPLRHLWSLAVEEQFYLFFPTIFILYLRNSQFSIRREDLANRILWSFYFGSMLLCIIFSYSESESLRRIAFFSVFARSWQFVAGVAVAIYVENRFKTSPRSCNYLAGISSIGICWTLFTAVEQRNYPGFWAIVPTLATSALLICSEKNSLSHRILSCRPLTWLGDLSYGIYLWHWPIAVFVLRRTELNALTRTGIVAATLLLSLITFRLVESPFRSWNNTFRQSLVMASLIFISLVAGSMLVKSRADAIQVRGLSPEVLRDGQLVRFGLGARDTFLNLSDVCHDPGASLSALNSSCSNNINANFPDVLVIGDSHAAAIGDGVLEAGRRSEVGVVGYFEYGCSMVPGVGLVSERTCEDFRRRVRELVSEIRPEIIIIAQSFTVYVTDEQEANSMISPSDDVRLPQSVEEKSKVLISGFQRELQWLTKNVRLVVVMEEVPFAIMPGTKTQEEFHAHEKLNRFLVTELRSQLKDLNQIKILDPVARLCPIKPPCALDADGKLMYFHKTHLNKNGSLRLTSLWSSLFNSQLK